MKIKLSKVIFMDESLVTIDGSDGWAKKWILSNRDVPVAKRKQQRGHSLMIMAGIVNQTITGPFKVNEKVKLNSANYCDFMNKTFLA